METLTLTPIGFAKTSKKLKFDAPHQPDPTLINENFDHIELNNDPKLLSALSDLDGFSHIWIIWWFHKNQTWNPKVLPPRGKAKKRGVFATRSPHRPNPIGISCVELKKIYKNKIFIGANDLVDLTPVFDIKPYLSPVDSIDNATLGWTKDLYGNTDTANYSIDIEETAAMQLKFLKDNFDIDFTQRAFSILSIDPSPHRTRRISKVSDDTFKMGCGAWRLFFSVDEKNKTISLKMIRTGYPPSSLIDPKYKTIPDRLAQIEFLKCWVD